jgi:hypothetical protein
MKKVQISSMTDIVLLDEVLCDDPWAVLNNLINIFDVLDHLISLLLRVRDFTLELFCDFIAVDWKEKSEVNSLVGLPHAKHLIIKRSRRQRIRT